MFGGAVKNHNIFWYDTPTYI